MTQPSPLPLPLDSWHRAHGGRMVGFAGYALPVQYAPTGALAERCRGGVLAEHRHCREAAALFDVSHMGQAILAGADAAAALERLVPGDIAGLAPGRQRYTLLTNAAGGIIDDLMVAKLAPDRLLLVVNAANKAGDFAHIAAALPAGVSLAPLDGQALLALQGPRAAAVLARLSPEAAALPFLGIGRFRLHGAEALISRSGYTGEDGFELSIPADAAAPLADALLAAPEVAPAGLGARDSLRLEAGLCLHGADIDAETDAIAAGLAWTIGKRRREAWDFPGGPRLRETLQRGPARRRVGLRPEGRAPVRGGAPILDPAGAVIGQVTSGLYSPSLEAPIAMGYVPAALAAPGGTVRLGLRGGTVPARVVPLPFVPHRYA
ncbi:MAG: glycine cleavage system aminomethyltransferase GcvT [Acetobacteraceae bacterium]